MRTSNALAAANLQRLAIRAARIEDIEWMAATGETVDGAARRLGIKRDALDRFLDVVERRDLWRALVRNTPAGAGVRAGRVVAA